MMLSGHMSSSFFKGEFRVFGFRVFEFRVLGLRFGGKGLGGVGGAEKVNFCSLELYSPVRRSFGVVVLNLPCWSQVERFGV